MKYITGEVYAYDPLENPPPLNTKINLINKYGVQSTGFWNDEFYIAWYPLLRIPKSVKERQSNEMLSTIESEQSSLHA